jgi:hypothetical protein
VLPVGTSGSMSVLVEAAQEAFQSEYVDPDGVQQRAPLAQTAGVRFEDCRPVRSFSVLQGAAQLPGAVVVGWQPRPHEGLRHPRMPARTLSPNELHAALVAAAGYLPVPLSAEDYLELLPCAWRSTTTPTTCPRCGCATTTPAAGSRSRGPTTSWSPSRLRTSPGARPAASSPPAGRTTPTRPPSPGRWPSYCAAPRLAPRLACGHCQDPQQDRRQRRAVARGRAVTGMPLRPQALPTSDPDPGEPAAATATGGEAEGPPATPAPTARVIPFGVFDPFNEEDYR